MILKKHHFEGEENRFEFWLCWTWFERTKLWQLVCPSQPFGVCVLGWLLYSFDVALGCPVLAPKVLGNATSSCNLPRAILWSCNHKNEFLSRGFNQSHLNWGPTFIPYLFSISMLSLQPFCGIGGPTVLGIDNLPSYFSQGLDHNDELPIKNVFLLLRNQVGEQWP